MKREIKKVKGKVVVREINETTIEPAEVNNILSDLTREKARLQARIAEIDEEIEDINTMISKTPDTFAEVKLPEITSR